MIKLTKTAPKAYVPDGLVKPNLDELRNKWTPETLTATLRAGSSGEVAFCQERLVRARWRQQQLEKTVTSMRQHDGPNDPLTAKTLARLECELSEARADAQYAEGQLDCASEECAA